MAAHTLSILIPLYNEEEFVGTLLERVLSAPLPEGVGREIIVVDDGPTDGSAGIVEEIAAAHPGVLRFIRHPAIGARAPPSVQPSSTPRASSPSFRTPTWF